MNRFNPKKLPGSKWTAVNPVDKQKHFEVTQVKYDASGHIHECIIRAVHSRATRSIDCRDLQSRALWQQGWK